MLNRFYLLGTLIGILFCSCQNNESSFPSKHIVFITGDEEYRSEESMPMLAQILKRNYGFRVSLCFSVDSNGLVDPNNIRHIDNLDALDDADMMVMFTRFRALEDRQLEKIIEFAESGKPMAGFRTATHAFRYQNDSTKRYYNEGWPRAVFGQQWITHHGHFGDGHEHLTKVRLVPTQSDHPILNGVKEFNAFSWLYHVHGVDHSLSGDSSPLLIGTALKSNHKNKDRLDRFPISNPVAWTKTYEGDLGTNRVFFTTLGHPYDFKDESMRLLAIQGILWALGLEEKILETGEDVSFASEYKPNNSGFGQKFKPGMRADSIRQTLQQ